MRITATIITILFALSACSLTPQSKFDMGAELAKLKGPEVAGIDKTLLDQVKSAEEAGEFKRAAQVYKQLLDKSPDNKDYAIAMSNDLRRSGDNVNALKIIDEVIKKNPKDANALEVKGLILMNTGEFAEAGKAFGEVMKIEPKRWRTLNAVAILFVMKKNNDKAISYYNESLAVSQDNPSVLNNLALTLALNKNYDAAIEKFTLARRKLSSGSRELKRNDLNMALVYAIAGKLDDAERVATPHLSKSALYNNMGFYSYISNNNTLAKSYLNMALTQNTTYYEKAWNNLNMVSDAGEDAGNKNSGDLSKSKN